MAMKSQPRLEEPNDSNQQAGFSEIGEPVRSLLNSLPVPRWSAGLTRISGAKLRPLTHINLRLRGMKVCFRSLLSKDATAGRRIA